MPNFEGILRAGHGWKDFQENIEPVTESGYMSIFSFDSSCYGNEGLRTPLKFEKNFSCYRDERFRTPSKFESEIGLWVERIGSGKNNFIGPKLRILEKYCVNYVVSGYGELVTPSIGKKKLKPGDVIYSFPEEPSSYYPTSDWESKWIVWNGPETENLKKLGFLNVMDPLIHDSEGIMLKAFYLLLDSENDENVASILERKTIILNMILELFRTKRKDEMPHPNNQRMINVVNYLKIHYREPILMSKLAMQFNFSSSHFRRVFMEYTGSTPKEFITSLRISRAKELLSRGKPVKEVSYLVGYNDVFYFMRLFKKITGMTPKKFKAVRF